MPGYIPVPVETEPTDLAGEAFDYIAQQVPGWLPAEGNLEAWLVEALAQIAGELRALAALVPDSIFAYYGESIVGLPPYPAVQATASTTWTTNDSAGYQVDAGTVIAVTPPASQAGYAFTVDADFTIPAGSTSVAGVSCTALEAGAAASGLTGAVDVIDSLAFISGVTLDAATSGGQDAETSDAYLARLSALLTLLSPRPILPQDFAVLVQRTIPEIARAVAIDLYNPGPPVDANCPRCVSVAICDVDGNPCSATVKTEADDLLQAQREVNFLTFILDPTYTTIDVSFSVMSYPGYDPADVAARVVSALTTYLSPSSWGVPPYGDTSARSWINATAVRYLELAEQINRVDGVHYIVTLAFATGGGTQGTADVALAGVAPMPRPGTITGTATAEA
jgi:baseplate J-like protein